MPIHPHSVSESLHSFPQQNGYREAGSDAGHYSAQQTQKAPVKFSRFLALACGRMIQSFFLKDGSRLPEHISNLQIICPESLSDAGGSLGGMTENVLRSQVRTARKQSDINSLHAEVAGKPKHLFPFQ